MHIHLVLILTYSYRENLSYLTAWLPSPCSRFPESDTVISAEWDDEFFRTCAIISYFLPMLNVAPNLDPRARVTIGHSDIAQETRASLNRDRPRPPINELLPPGASSETQGLQVGMVRYFRAKVYFARKYRAPSRLAAPGSPRIPRVMLSGWTEIKSVWLVWSVLVILIE